jgi:membrane dipeptidase
MKPDSPDPALLHRSALVIDTHADTPQRFLDEQWEFTADLKSGAGSGHLNLATARAGNLAAEFLVAWVDPGAYSPDQYVPRTLQLIDAVCEQVRLHPSELSLCTTPDEILTAHASGRFAAVLAVEGGHSIANSLALLRTYYQLGVRYMTLTWATSTDWAESSGDLRTLDSTIPAGLTSFGREVITEMNRLGMMIDVSHSSDRTLMDVLDTTRAPILASHSSARALCNAPRNLTDEQLRAIAQNGGAVMVNFYAAFVDDSYRQALNQSKPERDEAHRRLADRYPPGTPVPFHLSNRIDREFATRIPRASFESLMAHFDHIIRVAGIDHVGIGTDFDGISALPEGIDSAADLPKITAWLVARGYSADHIHKVLGGNLLRVFRAVQAAAGF